MIECKISKEIFSLTMTDILFVHIQSADIDISSTFFFFDKKLRNFAAYFVFNFLKIMWGRNFNILFRRTRVAHARIKQFHLNVKNNENRFFFSFPLHEQIIHMKKLLLCFPALEQLNL